MVAPERAASPSDKKGQRPQMLNSMSDDGSSDPSLPKDSPATAAVKSSFTRTGSIGKGTKKRPTAPHGPSLATEARSLVRPCNCGKDGVFSKGHGHTHDHHHKVPPSPDRVRREPKPVAPRSPLVSRKVVAPERKPIVKQTTPTVKQTTPTVKHTTSTVQPLKEKPVKSTGSNRFVSTVVWYPELQPEFSSTTLKLSPGEDSSRYIDEILVKEYDSYIKKMFPTRKNSQEIHQKGKLQKGKHTSTFRNAVQDGISTKPVSVS